MYRYAPDKDHPQNDASAYGERVAERTMAQTYSLAINSPSPEVRATAPGILMQMTGTWLQNRLSR
jgi:hypothetical protein